MMKKKSKAVGLLSGGLDSILAVRCMLELGVEVTPIHFLMPFMRSTPESIETSSMKRHCDQFGLKLQVVRLTEEYIDIVKKPQHGHGKHLNPCIDCKILFLQKAREVMEQEQADFIFTGEVIGQRPMSQQLWALEEIERKAGLEGLLLRPLSARKLPPTLAEKNGLIDREQLFAITGRSRAQQLALAARWEIEDFPNPAGGCLLTEKHFCLRLADLMAHDSATVRNCELLKFGRFFRLSPEFFIIVGRSQGDNDAISQLWQPGDILIDPQTLPGPTAIGVGTVDKQCLDTAMGIVARYTSPEAEHLAIRHTDKNVQVISQIEPLDDAKVRALMV